MDAKLNPEATLPSRHNSLAAAPPEGFRAPELAHTPRNLKTPPYISDLRGAGRYVAKDVFEGDGVPLLIRRLLGHGYLHGQCPVVRGRAVAETPRRVMWNKDQSVVRPAGKPLSATSGVVGLKGSRAPKGATGKVAGMAGLQFTIPARCFDGEEARFGAVKNKNYREGEVLVIRCEGPRSGSGMRELLAYTADFCGARQTIGPASWCATRSGAPAEKACHANL